MTLVRNFTRPARGVAARQLSRPGALARFGVAAPPALAVARWSRPTL
jgi:hypothetical protein